MSFNDVSDEKLQSLDRYHDGPWFEQGESPEGFEENFSPGYIGKAVAAECVECGHQTCVTEYALKGHCPECEKQVSWENAF